MKFPLIKEKCIRRKPEEKAGFHCFCFWSKQQASNIESQSGEDETRNKVFDKRS